ncbi:MAG: hypothetical protein VW625_08315, partial [Perlucidibaca sp.]
LGTGFNTRQIALDGILARLGQLQKPATTAGNGPVTATLNWSGNVDLDLALLEPDGYFVSARAGAAPGSTAFTPPFGHVGYISQDAEGGPGSETYRSNCSQLSTGTYLIGAQYAMDKAYAHSTSENWCASLLANGQAQGYSEFLKSYCGLDDPDISPAPASGQLTLHTPDSEQTLGLSWTPGSDISYFTTAGSFQLAARLDVRETSGNQDPNLNGKLEYTITPLSGAFPLPTAWQSVIAMWAGQG